MAAPQDTITCIYCKLELPPSREHILARSIGGDATRPITCSPCDTKILSPLAHALARRSIVAMSRAAYTPPDAFDVELEGNHFHYDRAKDMYTDVTLANGFRPHVFPQLHFRCGTDEISFTGQDHESVAQIVDFTDKLVARRTLRALHVKVGPVDRCSTGRLVLHRPNDGYVRVRAKGDENAIFDTLESKWKALREGILSATVINETHEKPTIHVGLSITLDDTFRAVAKTAFNVLASDVGTEFALRPEFDGIREYVLGRDIRHPETLEPDQVAVDGRFVRMLAPDQSPALPSASNEHMVTLFYRTEYVRACVTLYGDNSFFVKLGAIDLTSFPTVAHRFSITRSGNNVVSVEEAYDRITGREWVSASGYPIPC